MNKRLSYSWFLDPIIGFILTFLIVTLFFAIVWQIGSLIENQKTPLTRVFELIDSLLGVLIFLGLVIGFRPILVLRGLPNILYLKGSTFSFNKKIFFTIDSVESVAIRQVGFSISHMLYYEISLKTQSGKQTFRIHERFNLLNYFRNRYLIINVLMEMSLPKKKVILDDYSGASIFGFRDDTNETNANKK